MGAGKASLGITKYSTLALRLVRKKFFLLRTLKFLVVCREGRGKGGVGQAGCVFVGNETSVPREGEGDCLAKMFLGAHLIDVTTRAVNIGP